MPSRPCPSPDELAAYRKGTLSDAQRTELAAHVDDCRACQAVLETLPAAGQRDTARVDAPITPGAPAMSATEPAAFDRLGEYQLLEKLGQGGMGTVYKALHTKLGRTVAVKVLAPGRIGDARAGARENTAEGPLACLRLVPPTLHPRPVRPARPPCRAAGSC